MRFGWLTLSLSPSPEEDAARIDQQIEQVCFAEQLGFGDVWLTEHYFTGESVYNDALLFASAIAMRTERIRIGFAVVQLPFHHPVRLAVQLSLLDNLSKGRIDVGVGKGTIYNEYEFVGHGLRKGRSGDRRRRRAQVCARRRVAVRLASAGSRAGRGIARCRGAPPAVPDRVRRHDPRTEPGLDAPLRRAGDAVISPLGKSRPRFGRACSDKAAGVRRRKGKSFTVAALAAAGVKRISLATSLYRAAMTGLLSAAKEVREHGTFGYIDTSLATPDMNAFLRE